MSKLTKEKIEVLDKLYNIKGEKSIVKDAIQSKIDKKESAIETANAEKNSIAEQKEELQKELQLFIEQTDKFLATFSSCDNNSFSSFQSIGIDLPIGDMLTALRQKAPSHEDHLEARINELKEQMDEITERISSIEEKKGELVEKLKEAEEAKEKLNDLIDDILRNDNDAYPRKYVKEVLEGLCFFKEEEIAMLEFLILFKEEGLVEYDDGYELRGNKYEQGMEKTSDVVMLRGEIFTDDSDEDLSGITHKTEEKVETTRETIAPKATINLVPSSGVLTPVTTKNEEESAVNEFKEKKEVTVNAEEKDNNIFVEEEPIDMTQIAEEEIEEETEDEVVSAFKTVEEPQEDAEEQTQTYEETEDESTIDEIEEYRPSKIFNDEETEDDEVASTKEVYPRQQLAESTEEKKPSEGTNKIKELGLDLDKIKANEVDTVMQILNEADEETVRQNHELLKQLGILDETIYKVYDVEGDK